MRTESKGPSAVLAERASSKELLDGRVKLNPDALDLAPVPDVDLLGHSLEEHNLRFGRAFGESLLELHERLPVVFCLGLALHKLFVLVF